MYTSFTIDNFRGFEHLELTDLERVNLIAGKNNVGKTSLLEAIYVHYGRIDGLTSRIENEGEGWAPLFYGTDDSIVIAIDGKVGEETEFKPPPKYIYLPTQNNKLYVRNNNDNVSQYYAVVFINGHVTLINPNDPELNQYPISFIEANQKSTLKTTNELFSELIRAKRTEYLVDVMQVLEPRLKELDLLTYGIFADIGLPNLIPATVLGDGFNRIASIVMAIINVRDGIVLIDEIENGLHYSVHVDVWKAIAEAAEQFNVQIFATTHSLEMIRAAHRAFKDREEYDLKLIRLDREKDGKIVPKEYEGDVLEAALNMQLEVR